MNPMTRPGRHVIAPALNSSLDAGGRKRRRVPMSTGGDVLSRHLFMAFRCEHLVRGIGTAHPHDFKLLIFKASIGYSSLLVLICTNWYSTILSGYLNYQVVQKGIA
jgi:hypothetical protein